MSGRDIERSVLAKKSDSLDLEKMGADHWKSLRPEPAMSGEVDYGRYA